MLKTNRTSFRHRMCEPYSENRRQVCLCRRPPDNKTDYCSASIWCARSVCLPPPLQLHLLFNASSSWGFYQIWHRVRDLVKQPKMNSGDIIWRIISAFDRTDLTIRSRISKMDNDWPSPRKTRMVPVHCSVLMGLPNRRTEPRMVKNFLVVVTMEQVRGPKLTTVRKMKVWWRHAKAVGCAAFQDGGRVPGVRLPTCPKALVTPNSMML